MATPGWPLRQMGCRSFGFWISGDFAPQKREVLYGTKICLVRADPQESLLAGREVFCTI